MMKKTLLSLLLLVVATTMSAQSLLVGDANQDGALTLADVTETANLIVSNENQTVIDLAALAYKVDNTALVGTWYLGQKPVTFNVDGTTTYEGAATYEFRPVPGTLILYDDAPAPVKWLTVLKIASDGLLLAEGSTLLSYSSTKAELPEYIDLGLPSGTLWATCNIGAENPEDYGLYFAWGETTGYTQDTSDGHSFNWASYKWCNGSNDTQTKYCYDGRYGNNGFTDTLAELEPEDDAAYVNWGSGWRTPSKEQFDELINSSYTTTTWTTQNGVNGYKITSKSNSNSLFLPAAGFRDVTSLNFVGSRGSYWSRTLGTVDPVGGWNLRFDSGDIGTSSYSYRYWGQSVRPVRSPQ